MKNSDTPPSFYRQNRDSLLARFPHYAGILPETLPAVLKELIEIEEARSGDLTCRYDGIYLHSRHDPRREAARLADTIKQAPSGTAVIAGGGLGYLYEESLKLEETHTIILYESDPELFAALLGHRNLIEVFNNPAFLPLIGGSPGGVIHLLQQLTDRGEPLLWINRPRYQHASRFREQCDQLKSELNSWISRREVNQQTLSKFGNLWIRNLSANLGVMAASRGVEQLFGLFEDFPALILAAGPTLDEVIPHLKRLRESMVIIAVDTASRALAQAGIEPDILVVVDPQYWNTRHLEYSRFSTAFLVSESSTHPRIFQLASQNRFFCSSLFPLGQYLEQFTEIKGPLGAGGSVSTSAWDLARRTGASPLYLCGLDLSFPDRQTHYRDSYFENRAHILGNRLTPVETHSFHALYDAGPFWLEDQSGRPLLTDQRLSVYQGWFEQQFSRYPEPPSIFLSDRGLPFKGTTHQRLDELFHLPKIRDRIEALKAPLLKTAPHDNRSQMLKGVQELIGQMNHLSAILQKGIDLLSAPCPSPGQERDIFLQKLAEVDQALAGTAGSKVISFLLQEELRLFHQTSSQTKTFEESLNQTQSLYRHIYKSMVFHAETLQKGLQKNSMDAFDPKSSNS